MDFGLAFFEPFTDHVPLPFEGCCVMGKTIVLALILSLSCVSAFAAAREEVVCKDYEFVVSMEGRKLGCAPIPESGIVPKCGDRHPIMHSDGTIGCYEPKPRAVIVDDCAPGQRSVVLSPTHVGCRE